MHKKYPCVTALICNNKKKIYVEKIRNFKNEHDKSSLFSLKKKKSMQLICVRGYRIFKYNIQNR